MIDDFIHTFDPLEVLRADFDTLPIRIGAGDLQVGFYKITIVGPAFKNLSRLLSPYVPGSTHLQIIIQNLNQLPLKEN